MSRLIDADKIADFVCSVCGEICDDECRRVCLERQFTEECAKKMPTVDAEPVKHGHNANPYPSLFECSECGWRDSDTYTSDEIDGRVYDYNYCPNCGAKMDEVEDAKTD